MKLEIEINEGDDHTWLEVWRDHSAIVRDRAPKPKTWQPIVHPAQALCGSSFPFRGETVKRCQPGINLRFGIEVLLACCLEKSLNPPTSSPTRILGALRFVGGKNNPPNPKTRKPEEMESLRLFVFKYG